MKRPPLALGDWGLIGIYVGERQSDGVHVGYAAREENFRDWLLPLLERERLGT